MLKSSVSQHVAICMHMHMSSAVFYSLAEKEITCIPINGSVHINCTKYQSNFLYQWSKDGEVLPNPSPPNILTVTQRGLYTCTTARAPGYEASTTANRTSTENATSWIVGMANAFL